MPTIKELAGLIGQEAVLHSGGLSIYVIVHDVKQAHGGALYLCTPKAGYGFQWYDETSVNFGETS